MNISDSIPASEHIPYPLLTFYDSGGIVMEINQNNTELFPYNMLQHNREAEQLSTVKLIEKLRDGEPEATKLYNNDWLLFVFLFTAFIYGAIKTYFGKGSGNIINYVKSSLPTDHQSDRSADISSLFYGKSVITFLVSFLGIATYIYCAGRYFDLLPQGKNGFLFLLICFAAVLLLVLLRHLLCVFVGRLSGQTKVFEEYIVTIYNSYKYMAMGLYILSIMIVYTRIIPLNILFYISFGVVALTFLIRYIRLFQSFLKSNISILYLILYLCALEILPVAVVLKHFQGMN